MSLTCRGGLSNTERRRAHGAALRSASGPLALPRWPQVPSITGLCAQIDSRTFHPLHDLTRAPCTTESDSRVAVSVATRVSVAKRALGQLAASSVYILANEQLWITAAATSLAAGPQAETATAAPASALQGPAGWPCGEQRIMLMRYS